MQRGVLRLRAVVREVLLLHIEPAVTDTLPGPVPMSCFVRIPADRRLDLMLTHQGMDKRVAAALSPVMRGNWARTRRVTARMQSTARRRAPWPPPVPALR